jgi:hypothetical protein
MAYQLVAMVRHHAPRTITTSQKALLLLIAESVWTEDYNRDGTRTISLSYEALAADANMSVRAAQEAIRRLARDHGIVVRVAISKDLNGQPVYATRGRSVIFQVPEFPPPAGCACTYCRRPR